MYCAIFPEFVRNFVCIESAGPLTEPESTSVAQLKKAIESRIEANQKAIRHPKDVGSIVQARQRVSDLSAENAAIILQRNITHDARSEDIQWSTDKRLRTVSSLRLTQAQVENLMQGIQCPIHFVLASNGFSKVSDLMVQRKKLFKDAKLTIVEGGHHVHMEAEKLISEIILQHCSQ